MGAEPRRSFARAAWLSLAAVALGVALLSQACFRTAEAPRPLLTPSPRLSSPGALSPFFASLDAVETGVPRRRVRVLQIGDSHTANDSFSGRMRDRLQARFGPAGRGWLPAGVPYKYYRPHLVSVA